MKFLNIASLAMVLKSSLVVHVAHAADPEPDPKKAQNQATLSNDAAIPNPNAVSVGLGGRAVLYSLNYDRMLSPSVAVGGVLGIRLWGGLSFGAAF